MARLLYIHFADLMLEIKERSLTDMAAYGIVIASKQGSKQDRRQESKKESKQPSKQASKLSLILFFCQAAYCTNLEGGLCLFSR